ncbi:hypothetical protein QO001_004578 [Methylobacterium brachiatum]|uniref:Uncharacterized protein n=1 Tax=Methylobacterium brachiatum TaxID=269660 RepID=A0AAJ1TVL5_9HYPH|nr:MULTISPECIES: hypothetical protein [Methylobacterium]MCB4804597.1 hypothetical protein [Methylobacterium brachiatum]MDQ0545634.1 hypothetical protein [Methylobacterium brachiatum]RUP16689.1 MAG: hypothetical protein EKK43_00790 [Methylobacterium sp.]
MKMARKLAKTKRTVNGKYLGRPVKKSKNAAPVIEKSSLKAKPARMKLYLKRLRNPELVTHPITGETVRPFGPPKPVYEWREAKPGRPPVSDFVALLRIIKVIQHTGQHGFSAAVAEQEPHRKIDAVKQEYRRERRAMRRRAEENS